MIVRLFASALLAAGLSQAALAQTNTQQNQTNAQQNQTNAQQNQDLTSAENTQAPRVPQLLRERLTSAGFNDVNVVPRSLVITARDRDGRPVLMRITPNSMFFLTEIAAVSRTGAAAQGSKEGAQQDQASTSAENTQPPATTGLARGGSNDTAQQDQASTSADNTQAPSQQAPSQQAPSQQALSQNAPQSLRDRLASAGFSDVRIVPSSLVITAKDQSDRPVMMHITPRSISFLTEVPAVSASTTGADEPSASGRAK
jgi:hypothetical protein